MAIDITTPPDNALISTFPGHIRQAKAEVKEVGDALANSATEAASSAASALASEQAAARSESAALASQIAAATSETNAALSESNASASEIAAGISETEAAQSAAAALSSEQTVEAIAANFSDMQAHIGIVAGNPHGTDWDQLSGAAAVVPFDTSAVAPARADGKLFWDSEFNCLAFYSNGATMQIGQEGWLRATNKSGGTLAAGTAVSILGATGDQVTIAKTDATNQTSARCFVGLTTEEVSNNDAGFVTFSGNVNDLNTAGFTAGDRVWVSTTTAGAITNTEPVNGAYKIRVGTVARANANNGRIYVSPLTIPKPTDLSAWPADVSLDDLANVLVINVTGDGAQYLANDGTYKTVISGGGVTDHGALTGLSDDDHTQYLNETRHDLLDHTGLTGIPSIAGLLDETAHDLLDHSGLAGIPAQYTDEMAQDAVGAAIAAGTQSGISVTYDDTNNKFDFTVTAAGAGDVTGPASSINNNIAVFDGITGKVIKDGGVALSGLAASDHNHTGTYAPALGADDNYVTDAEKAALHAAVTVADSTSIDLTLTGQQISAAAIFGTTSGTVAEGDHTHASLYQPLDQQLTDLAGLNYAGNAGKIVAVKTTEDGIELVEQSSGGGQAVTVSGALSLYITQQTTLTITNYDSATSYSVSAVSGSASIAGDTITYTAGNAAGADTLTITAGASSRDITITVNAAGVATPTNSSPANGATEQMGPTLTLSASAFEWVGLEDTHASSDWELATDSGFTTVVDSSYTDTSNKTSWAADVSTSQTYYWRVRYRGASGRVSDWSTGTSFSTKATFGGLIGTQGTQGVGVGIYNGTLPSGFSAMTGTTDPASDNYGNYQYTNGSIMCFVPKFYYRIGSASSARYTTYGLNAVDIAGVETFADEAAANAAGYALHRAFIDGGSVKSGFFVDKYLASKDGTASCKSVKNGVPISLTTTTTYTRSSDMTGCTGILADSVVLSRARGAGTFNVASIFMYSALALLSLAHGQAATATTYCAWYDSGLTTNFPKGCNNNALADVNDTSVTFTTAGDSGASAKPLTGSASNLAKTTHNGQNCGVADLNGAMWQVMLGLTNPGTSGTATTQQTNGDAYILKTSVALSSLTSGWNGTNDAWGDASNLANKYDNVSALLPWGSAVGWLYMGNGSNRVFDPATSGAGYQRTACGIPQDTSALSAAGTNQYGKDGQYQYNRANLFPVASGNWTDAATAGVFCRNWNGGRSTADDYCGFRAAAYGA